ncbi:MAG: exonuclease domain-containing protein [Gammaproteobacteria bacterium]
MCGAGEPPAHGPHLPPLSQPPTARSTRARREVHGITLESLQGKPRFAELAEELKAIITGAELVIHNAAFDVAYSRCRAAAGMPPRRPRSKVG